MMPSKPERYSLFALLYFSQGAVLSFFTAFNAIYLLSHDVSMTRIGLMGTIALLPFIFKIFLGMLSDRVNLLGYGHRKPYILIGLVVQAVCLLVVPQVNPGTHFWLYVALAFLLQLGMALYDTCTDGLALDTTPPEEEGTIQGFMVGGRALGVVLIAGIIGLVADRFSWAVAFYTLAALSLLPIPLLLKAREIKQSEGRRFEWGAFKAFAQPAVIGLGLLGALYSLIINGANEIVNPFLQSRFSISTTQAGFLTAVWGLGVVLGGITGGRLTDRLGHARATQVAMIMALAAIVPLAFIPSAWLAWGLVAVFGLAYGFYETVYFAISMNYTDRRIAASMFALLMAVANIGTGIGLGISGALVDSLGYPITFIILAGLNLLAIPLLTMIFGRATEKVQEY
ncbi:MAG TPA: MFS transporter [Anaerolineaceae bacterium]|nr:MFS transporter [Anaerolineaceae bacterium]HQH85680.1 MFS transporter [Anaerolineaceae bacterium]